MERNVFSAGRRPPMLTLMLLRHAKAESHGATDDFERALTERGEDEAARLGRYLKRTGYSPTHAIVSSAKRTTQTFEIVSSNIGGNVPARFERDLYNATGSELCEVVAGAETTQTLMIVGHNPGILEVALSLAQEGDLSDLDRLRSRFPPCALAVLTFSGDDWRDAKCGGRLEMLVLPDDLERRDNA